MASQTKKSVFEQVDTFIQRLHDVELTFKLQVKTDKEFKYISTRLSDSMRHYQQARSESHIRRVYANLCLFWIDRAYTMGFIEVGEGITTKISRLETDNERLQKRLDECNKERQKLEDENKRFRKLFPDPDTFTGDVVGE